MPNDIWPLEPTRCWSKEQFNSLHYCCSDWAGRAVVNLVNTENSAGLQMHDCWHETAQTSIARGMYKQCFRFFQSETFSSGWPCLRLLAPHTPSSFFAYAPFGDCMTHKHSSPMELACNPVFLKQRLIVRLHRGNVWHLVAFRVKIKTVKLFHPTKNLSIFKRLQVSVVSGIMPRIKRMESYHPQTFFWNCAPIVLQGLIHVLIVPPCHKEVGDTTTRSIDASFCAVRRVTTVGIVFEKFGKHALLRESAAHRKCIANNAPLWRTLEGHDLSHIMQQAH